MQDNFVENDAVQDNFVENDAVQDNFVENDAALPDGCRARDGAMWAVRW